jgi:hypothetical protein
VLAEAISNIEVVPSDARRLARIASSHSLHQDAAGVLGQRSEIFRVGGEDRPRGFRESHDERVDGRSLARSSTELGGSSGERFRQLVDDITCLEKAVGLGVAPSISLETLDQDHRWNGWRPEPLLPKSQDQGDCAL